MDSILTLILIWVVISLLNYFSKRSKKAEKPKPISTAPPPPVKGKSEIPPFLREIFNIPEEKEPPIPASPEIEMSESKDSEYSIEREALKALKERKTIKEKVSPPVVKETVREPVAVPITAGEELEITWKYSKIGSLKDAVVWKEILDKPISMRPFRYRRRI